MFLLLLQRLIILFIKYFEVLGLSVIYITCSTRLKTECIMVKSRLKLCSDIWLLDCLCSLCLFYLYSQCANSTNVSCGRADRVWESAPVWMCCVQFSLSLISELTWNSHSFGHFPSSLFPSLILSLHVCAVDSYLKPLDKKDFLFFFCWSWDVFYSSYLANLLLTMLTLSID